MAEEADPAELNQLREQIDSVDRALVAALSDRARLVQQIGALKSGNDTPTYVPHRERQVIDKVLALNPGPLPNRALEAIYRELMSGSFRLESGLKIGFLGPRGSFSHLAATRHFGSSVDCEPLSSIEDVFEGVSGGQCDFGLVPYENSISGGVSDTLDAFQRLDVTICAETPIAVSHALLARCLPTEIQRIYSKPQIFGQCRRWLNRHFPDAIRVPTSSSAAAVEAVAKGQPGDAAIGSTLAAEIYQVEVIHERIQDDPDNVTRFLVLGKTPSKPTGNDKTTLMFVTRNTPGALVDVLAVFRESGLNLSHIEKRPSGRRNWEYTFFIDCETHRDSPQMQAALSAARKHCLSLEVLGSYPRGQQVL